VSILLPENAVTVIRGVSKTLLLYVKDKHKEPADLTGSTIYFSVKVAAEDPHPLIQKVSADIAEIEIPNPTDGIAKIYLQPADTQNLDFGKYVFDAWMINSAAKRFVVVKPSVFEVRPGVTWIPL